MKLRSFNWFYLNSFKTDEDNGLELDEDGETAMEVCTSADNIDIYEQVSFIPQQSPAERAVQLYEFLELSSKTCNCHCRLNDGSPCISQFSQEEQDTIRYEFLKLI